MADRIKLATEYIQGELAGREDIVAAWIGGSTAQGQETEASDIDITFVVRGHPEAGVSERIINGLWRDEVYFQVSDKREEDLRDAEKVLGHGYLGTRLRDVQIIHDPKGRLADLQKEVQARYMEPQWIAARVNYFAAKSRAAMATLEKAIPRRLHWETAQNVGEAMFGLVCVRLHLAGTAPSSTRHLTQLEAVAPQLTERIARFEADPPPAEIPRLLPLVFADFFSLLGNDRIRDSGLLSYFQRKTEWLADHRHHGQVIHTLWRGVGYVLERVPRRHRPKAEHYLGEWFSAVGWGDEENWRMRAEQLLSLRTEMENLARSGSA